MNTQQKLFYHQSESFYKSTQEIYFMKQDYVYVCKMKNNTDIFKKIISHTKEHGFIFQSSEIYDNLAAVYDYGPFGSELKNNRRFRC